MAQKCAQKVSSVYLNFPVAGSIALRLGHSISLTYYLVPYYELIFHTYFIKVKLTLVTRWLEPLLCCCVGWCKVANFTIMTENFTQCCHVSQLLVENAFGYIILYRLILSY